MDRLVDFSRIPVEGKTFRCGRSQLSFPPSQHGDGTDFRDVLLDVEVQPLSDRFAVTGSIRASSEFSCSRCLKPFEVLFSESFSTIYVLSSNKILQECHQVESEDIKVVGDQLPKLDLDTIIMEQLARLIPIKPICSDRCEGLCPMCGIDRNVDRCTCSPQKIDPRLEPLRSFRKKLER